MDKSEFLAMVEERLKEDRASLKRLASMIKRVSAKKDRASRANLSQLRWYKKEVEKSAAIYEKFLAKLSSSNKT